MSNSPTSSSFQRKHPMHHQPTIAAAQRGIHVFCEKPIALNLIEADEMVATCDQHGVKFAINHIKRASPYNRHVLSLIDQGAIGQVVLLQATDKGGRKVGNSLMEMGTHLYDWVRLFGGDVEWTHAHLVQMDGRESTVDDIKHTQEVHPKRPRCGDCARRTRARLVPALPMASTRTCSSSPSRRPTTTATALTSSAPKGASPWRESVGTTMFIHKGQHKTPAEAWEPVHLPAEDLDEHGNPRDRTSIRLLLQRLILRDLIAAIEEDREPFASGRDGRDCLEMIQATWESHRRKARVYMPG